MTGHEFDNIREKLGLTQKELAECLGTSQGTISRISRKEEISERTRRAVLHLRDELRGADERNRTPQPA